MRTFLTALILAIVLAGAGTGVYYWVTEPASASGDAEQSNLFSPTYSVPLPKDVAEYTVTRPSG
jgi:hypothetical protein